MYIWTLHHNLVRVQLFKYVYIKYLPHIKLALVAGLEITMKIKLLNRCFFKKLLSITLVTASITASAIAVPVHSIADTTSTTAASTTSSTANNASSTAASTTTSTAASNASSANSSNASGNNSIWPVAPDTVSGSAILIDADTGAILYQKNAYEKAYPASTTKILTGLLTLENCSMDETVTFSSTAANSVTWEDASLGTKTGEEYSVEQALYGLLLYSANEIAYGLAEHVSGSLAAFTDLMNSRAKELGAINTHFSNASGLYDANHYTTAYDMAMIARGCYNNSSFVNIDSTYTSYTIGPTNVTPENRTFRHRHLMLKDRAYYYEYCKGGKTGFTDQSGHTLVTFAEKDNMRLICVCFKSNDTDRFVDTRNLFDWAFNNFQKLTVSSNTLSSLFSNDNYYNSSLYGQYKFNSNLNASTLTIPKTASLGDVKISINDNVVSGTSSDNNAFTRPIVFKCNDNTVGTASLSMYSSDAANPTGNLPYIAVSNSSSSVNARNCLVINIWLFMAIVIVISICVYAYHLRQDRKRHVRRKSKLHF